MALHYINKQKTEENYSYTKLLKDKGAGVGTALPWVNLVKIELTKNGNSTPLELENLFGTKRGAREKVGLTRSFGNNGLNLAQHIESITREGFNDNRSFTSYFIIINLILILFIIFNLFIYIY